jgi:hypothetical protein
MHRARVFYKKKHKEKKHAKKCDKKSTKNEKRSAFIF